MIKRFIANKHDAKYVFKKVREWTRMTQEEFGIRSGKSRAWTKNIEGGRSRFYFEDFLKICNDNDITITIEKN